MPNTGIAEVEQRGIQLRGALGVHTGRAAGQHDGLRILGLDLLDAGGVRDDLGVHPRLADPARDQLRVLRAEVDHQHGAGGGGLHRPSLVAGWPPDLQATPVVRSTGPRLWQIERVCVME